MYCSSKSGDLACLQYAVEHRAEGPKRRDADKRLEDTARWNGHEAYVMFLRERDTVDGAKASAPQTLFTPLTLVRHDLGRYRPEKWGSSR